HNPNVYLSGRNLPTVQVMNYADVAAYHILWSDKVVIEEAALTGIEPEVGDEPAAEPVARKARPAAARARAAKATKTAAKATKKAAKAAKKSKAKATKKAAPKKAGTRKAAPK